MSITKYQPNRSYVLDTTVFACVSSLVGFKLGSVLNCYSFKDRREIVSTWIKFSSGEYPEVPKRKIKALSSKRCFVEFLELYADLNAELRSKPEVVKPEIESFCERYFEQEWHTGVLINAMLATGCYFGMYSTTHQIDKIYFDELTTNVYMAISKDSGWGLKNKSVFQTVVYLISNLLIDGYFGVSNMDRAIDKGYCRGYLADAVDYCNRNHLTEEMLWGCKVPAHLLEDLNYIEKLFLISLFYMYKIDVADSGMHKPRYMLKEVVRHKDIGVQDLLQIFSMICCASEHEYGLYGKALREGITEVSAIEAALSGII